MKLDINKLNNRLKEYNQISQIFSYSANPRKLVLNNIEYYNNGALRIIRRINGGELWIINFDRIYYYAETDIEKMSLLVNIDDFDPNTQKKIRMLNETYKKNGNR